MTKEQDVKLIIFFTHYLNYNFIIFFCCRIIFPLFSGDASESSIIFFRYGGYDPAKIKMETLFKMVCMCLDIDIFENNLAIINGMRALCDFKSVTLAHAPPVVLSKKFLLLLQSAFPRRMKEVHFINTHPIADKLLIIIEPLWPKKLKNKVSITIFKKINK